MKLKKSSPLVRVIILIVLVYATVTLVHLQGQIAQKKGEAEQLAAQVTQMEQENAMLQQSIDRLSTDEGVIEAARDKLGMVRDGEIIFYDKED